MLPEGAVAGALVDPNLWIICGRFTEFNSNVIYRVFIVVFNPIPKIHDCTLGSESHRTHADKVRGTPVIGVDVVFRD